MGRKKEVKLKCYVLTISRNFPQKTKRAGEPTLFFDKIESGEKLHTIRMNWKLWKKRFKAISEGKAYLSVRYWTGKPYNSPQEIYKDFYNTDGIGVQKLSFVNGRPIIDNYSYYAGTIEDIAKNDGLSYQDFTNWFGANVEHFSDMVIIHFSKFRYFVKF